MTLRSPWNLAAWSMMRCSSSGKSDIRPSMAFPLMCGVVARVVLGPAPRQSIDRLAAGANLCKVKPCCPAQMPQSCPTPPHANTHGAARAGACSAAFGCGIALAQAPNAGAGHRRGGASSQSSIPLPRPRPKMGLVPSWIATLWSEPKTFREAAGEDFKTSEVTSAPSACRQRLEKFAVIDADAAADRAGLLRRRRHRAGRCGDGRRQEGRDQAGALSAMPDGRATGAVGARRHHAAARRRRRRPEEPRDL